MKTYQEILNETLARVPDTVDKREGSIIYNAIAPACYAIYELYRDDEILLNETFADTASREYLIKRCAERNITPYEASAAIYIGKFNVEIPMDTMFMSGDTANLKSKNQTKIESGFYFYELECTQTGTEYNNLLGHELIPLDTIVGLQKCEFDSILSMGTDEEDTEHLRARYFESIQYEPFAGNKQAYRDETNAISGILATKVLPVNDQSLEYNVLLIVAGDGYQPVPDEKLTEIKNYYCPDDENNIGRAPIFHKVAVQSCVGKVINFKIAYDYKSGGNVQFSSLIERTKRVLQDYLNQQNQYWEKEDRTILRIHVVLALLYDQLKEYIDDVTGIRINDSSTNVTLSNNEVAILGQIEELTSR